MKQYRTKYKDCIIEYMKNNEDHRLCVSLNEWNEFLATLYTIREDLFR